MCVFMCVYTCPHTHIKTMAERYVVVQPTTTTSYILLLTLPFFQMRKNPCSTCHDKASTEFQESYQDHKQGIYSTKKLPLDVTSTFDKMYYQFRVQSKYVQELAITSRNGSYSQFPKAIHLESEWMPSGGKS